jgi:hypothetical protein
MTYAWQQFASALLWSAVFAMAQRMTDQRLRAWDDWASLPHLPRLALEQYPNRQTLDRAAWQGLALLAAIEKL